MRIGHIGYQVRSIYPGLVPLANRPPGWLEAVRELRKVRLTKVRKVGVRKKKKALPLTPEMSAKVALLPEALRKELGL